jgi:hypothetical protein
MQAPTLAMWRTETAPVSVRGRPTPPQLLPQPPLSPTRSRPQQSSLHLATIRATHASRPTQSSSSGFTRYLRHGRKTHRFNHSTPTDSPSDARSLTQRGRSWCPHTSSQVYRMHSSSPPSFEPPTRTRSGFPMMRAIYACSILRLCRATPATRFLPTTIISFLFLLPFPPHFPLPSGDRLASIVFLFETGLLPNIDDAAPRLPLSRLSCYRLGPLLFFFSEAGSRFSVWPKRDLSFLCGAFGQIQSS